MFTMFYNSGRIKKKKYHTYIMSAWAGQEIFHRVWMGEWEEEPSRVKSKNGKIWIDEAPSQKKKKNLPKEFLPKPAYRGAK